MLAQAALETRWGASVLPGTNNIFNIKADKGWKGPSKEFQVTEYVNGQLVTVTDKFRVYSSVEEAFADRVKFLEQNPRYSALFSADVKGDLLAEAKALQAAGYATDPLYANKLQAVFDGKTMQSALEIAGALVSSGQPKIFGSDEPTGGGTVQFGPYAVIDYGVNVTPTILPNNQGVLLSTDYPGGIHIESSYGANGLQKSVTVSLPNGNQIAVASQNDIQLSADGRGIVVHALGIDYYYFNNGNANDPKEIYGYQPTDGSPGFYKTLSGPANGRTETVKDIGGGTTAVLGANGQLTLTPNGGASKIIGGDYGGLIPPPALNVGDYRAAVRDPQASPLTENPSLNITAYPDGSRVIRDADGQFALPVLNPGDRLSFQDDGRIVTRTTQSGSTFTLDTVTSVIGIGDAGQPAIWYFPDSAPVQSTSGLTADSTNNGRWLTGTDGSTHWIGRNADGKISVTHESNQLESFGGSAPILTREIIETALGEDGSSQTTRTLSDPEGQLLERSYTQYDAAGEERLRIETNAAGEVDTRWQGEGGRQLEGNAQGIEQKTADTNGETLAGLDFLGYVSFASFTPDNTLSTTRSGPGGAYRNERRNAAGQVIASTVIEADGSATLSTMAGNASTVRRENADGSVVVTVTDGNGVTRDLTTRNADGSSGYWVYDAQGKLQSSATLAADGGSVTATYHGNGNPKLEITLNPDGARIDHQHSEDGHSGRIDARNADGTLVTLVYSQNASDVTTRHPDGRIETKTTANGIVTGEYTRHPDGGEDIYRRVVNADGSVVEEWTWADGARKQLYYHPNGKLASESAFAADRSGYLRQYADSGRLISSAVYNADGSGSETFYPENGDPSTREWNGTPPTELRPWTATTIAPDGTTTLTHHRADGSVERIEIRRPDGSVKITDYHPSGAPVQTVASNFADQFTGSAISDLEHRDSQSPSGDGDGYRFTATPASYVARYAGTGQMIEQTLTYADGSTNAMYYFADGKLAEETRRDLDGASRTLAFHVSGKKALEEEIDVDGSQERVSYFANGHVAEAVKRGADGSPVASESAVYRSNGSLAHQRIQQADGSVVELSQLANGASVKETRSADGAVVRVTDDGKGNERTARFDADGNRAREEWKRPDGTWGFDDYLADGSSRGATVSAQFRSNYQDDGRGNRTEILFDTASDERVGERRLRADGSVTTVWHHAGGVSSGNVALAGGNGLSWLDDGAGKIRYDYRFTAIGRIVVPESVGVTRELMLGEVDRLSGMTVTAILSDASGEAALLLSLGNGRELVLEGGLTGSEDRFVVGGGLHLNTAGLMARANVLPVTIETAAGRLVFGAAEGVLLAGGDASATLVGWGRGQTLEAGAGVSRLIDGTGTATFVVRNSEDEIVQLNPGAGGGTVLTSVSYSLEEQAPDVANLTLTGGPGLTAVGNARENVLTASESGSVLDGGGGRDTLRGGAGRDVFLFGLGSGEETVIDSWQAGDTVRLRDGLTTAHLIAVRDGGDLLLGIVGSQGDSMRLRDYFSASVADVVVEDAAGDAMTADSLLEATAADPYAQAMAGLQKTYIDGIRNELLSTLLANQRDAYTLQPDGSYLSKTFFYGNEWNALRALSAPDGGYTVSHAVSYLDGRPATAFVTQNSWIPFSYHGLQPGSGYEPRELLSDTTVAIDVRRSVASAAQVIATTPLIQTDSWEQKWVRVDWQSGQWKSTANHVVPVIDASGAVIGFDQQTIVANTPWALEYRGTARGNLLDSPGNLTTGVQNAQATPVSFAHHKRTHTIETLYLGDDTQEVTGNAWTVVNAGRGSSRIRNAGFVHAGAGDHVIENAGVAYGGSGNNRFIGGDTVHAGSGDDVIIGAKKVHAGGGLDRVIVSADGVLQVDGEIGGVTQVSGTGLTPQQVLDRFYQRIGIAGWSWGYEHAGEKYYLLSHPDFGSGVFSNADEALAELRRNGAGTMTLEQAISRHYLLEETVQPLPVLATVAGLDLQPSTLYAEQALPRVHLSSNDFATLAAYGVDTALDSLRFESGIKLADLHFSWTQARASMDGLRRESLHAALRVSWGSGSEIQVLIPHADDPVGSAIGYFRFSDGVTKSLSELIEMSRPAPDFDPHIYKFGEEDGDAAIPAESYEGLRLEGDESRYIFGREDDDLLVSSVGGARNLRVSGWFDDSLTGRQVSFDAGRVWAGLVGRYGSDDIDVIGGRAESEFLFAKAGDDRVFGGGGNDYIVGGDGDDQLAGGDGHDVLEGGIGSDLLFGDTGDDILHAGPDGGFMQGGRGDDTYIFSRGDGAVMIDQRISPDDDRYAGSADIDVVRFGSGVSATDLQLVYSTQSATLTISIGDTADVLSIIGWRASWGRDYARQIARFEFADGTVWTDESIPMPAIDGGEGDDHLVGTIGDDRIYGNDGNDALYGLDGADRMSGGRGNDTLIGDGGSDTMNGEEGDDSLIGGDGDDSMDGGAGRDVMMGESGLDRMAGGDGDDSLYGFEGNDLLDGGEGDDHLDGGAGDDTIYGNRGYDHLDGGSGDDLLSAGADGGELQGGAGNDVYLVERGNGTVKIRQALGVPLFDDSGSLIAGPSELNAAASDIDVVRFGNGISPEDVVLSYDTTSSSLRIAFRGSDDVVQIIGWEEDAIRSIARYEFDDGTVWTPETMPLPLLEGTESGDWLIGTPGRDAVSGGNGNDYLFGMGGSDVMRGGDGDDYLDGGAGNDKLSGGSGFDWLYGGAGNDVLHAGPDGGGLQGGAGDDFFLVERGDGVVRIDQRIAADVEASDAMQYARHGDVDVIRFGDGISPGEIRAVHDRSSALLTLTLGGGDSVVVAGWHSQPDIAAAQDIARFEFADGTVWTAAEIDALTQNHAPAPGVVLTVQQALEGSVYRFDIPTDAFVDEDAGDALLLSATLADGSPLPAWLQFDAEARAISGTPEYHDTGSIDITITATDLAGASVSQTFSLTIEASTGITLVGTASADTLIGTGRNDTLDGGAGRDRMVGGAGNDTYYVDNSGDTVLELAGEGTDTVISTVSLALAANVETLTLAGSANLAGTGNALDNLLVGNAANNALNGGLGVDTMMGGIGNDTYYVDNLGDIVTEFANEGTDRVISTVSHALGDNVENLTLFGSESINGSGNDLNNTIVGNAAGNVLSGLGGNDSLTGGGSNDTLLGGAGNDTLNGGLGADAMAGGVDNDTYYVDNAGDVVTEYANEGTDRVISTISYTLPDNVENLTLSGAGGINGIGNALANSLSGNAAANLLDGSDGNDSLNGGEGDDTLLGSAGNDTLNGGIGADSMTGGVDNDTYYVENIGDLVTEFANEGTDRVVSTISYTLGDNLENLALSGTVAISGTGNELNNTIVGNVAENVLSGMGGNDSLTGGDSSDTLLGGAGNDSLNGGLGADTMAGGSDNDTYYVDNMDDVVTELANEGTDRVISTIGYTLGDNIENLTLSGSAAVNGVGNALANSLAGNAASNLLNGGEGNDTMNGAAGIDFLEGMAGNDTLSDTSGSGYFNGGAGADRLTGSSSADFFLGGAGNDTITSGDGDDIIVFNKGDGQDTFAAGGTGNDTLSLGGGVEYADLAFRKSSNDLVLKIGASDQITFKNWYAATPSKPVLNLQMIAEAMADFSAGGIDPLKDQKIENFDFAGLAGAFDAARVANPGLTSWALTNALTSFQLAGSDTAAIGGDLAYQYGKNGTLAGIGLTSAQQVIGDANFGTQAQTLRPLATIQEGAVRLS